MGFPVEQWMKDAANRLITVTPLTEAYIAEVISQHAPGQPEVNGLIGALMMADILLDKHEKAVKKWRVQLADVVTPWKKG